MATSHASTIFWDLPSGDHPPVEQAEASSTSTPWLLQVSEAEFAGHLDAKMRGAEQTNSTLSAVFLPGAQITGRALSVALAAGVWPRDRTLTTTVAGAGTDGIQLLLPGLTAKEAREATAGVARLLPDGHSDPIVHTYPDDVVESILGGRSAAHLPFLARKTKQHRKSAWLKRLIDIGGGWLGLILLAPVFAIVAAAIAISSPGPVIFRQTRLGQDGRRFTLYKFRSMVHKADPHLHQQYVTQIIASSNGEARTSREPASWTQMPDDPRITTVGKWLRRLKLDELPQLVNVVKGDLSLVGPRPALEYEVVLYQPWHFRRMLGVKPGLTGLWQVEGGDHTTFDDMIRMDLNYIDRWSNRLDLLIITQTIMLIFRRIVESSKRRK